MFHCGASVKLAAEVHVSRSVQSGPRASGLCATAVCCRLLCWGRLVRRVCPILPCMVTRFPDHSLYCGKRVHLVHLYVTSALLAVPRITNAEARASRVVVLRGGKPARCPGTCIFLSRPLMKRKHGSFNKS